MRKPVALLTSTLVATAALTTVAPAQPAEAYTYVASAVWGTTRADCEKHLKQTQLSHRYNIRSLVFFQSFGCVRVKNPQRGGPYWKATYRYAFR
ncbi:hypothetical protein [Luteococcus peritonei]|uniref:Uncharacterized protein n=1 Tax=Luteococcus peritonei TaxID=88874 RepID=A0ABW4S0U4_9ACTN